MAKKRNWLRTAIFWALLLIVLALFVWKVGIPLFSNTESSRVHQVSPYGYNGETEPLTLENDTLRFEIDPATTRFTVTDKRTGAEWASSPADADKDPNALPVEKNRIQSDLTLVYSISTGMETFLTSHEYSVANQVFQVVREGENCIRADFTVGNVSRTYMIPPVITDERFNEFLSKLTKEEADSLKKCYQKKDPNNLKKKDNPEEILAMYPDFAEHAIWIERDTNKEYQRLDAEEKFKKAGYTAEDYAYDRSRVAGESDFSAAAFNVSLLFTLEGGDLVVSIPLDQVSFVDGNYLKTISVLPGFGAGGLQDTGFILVPDGNGGVIRFNNGRTDQNAYYGNLYGWDWASLRTQVTNETSCSFPVFGISRNGASVLCMIEQGAQWSGISADISMHKSSYNTVYNTFTVMHGDPYDASDRDINAKYLFEEEIPEGSLVQRYRFLETDDVTGMALAYRDYLENGILKEHAAVNENPPVYVELLGAVDKVQQRFGIPSLVAIPMTTYREATDILEKLTGDGFTDFSLGYTGWMNGGLNQRVLNKVSLLGELGSEKDLKDYLAKAKEKGVVTYLDGLTAFARNSGILDGFVYVRDSAKLTTQELVKLRTYSTIWYGPDTETGLYYLLKPELMQKHAQVLQAAAKQYGADGVAFRDVGSLLSSDYDRKHLVTRAQSLALQQEIFENVRKEGQKVLTKKGFDYALSGSDLVVDMDFDGGNYGIIEYYAPFYPMAIHGLANYTGVSWNLSNDTETLILQTAEAGAGLSFTFSAESAEKLQNTYYSAYYGADIGLVYDRVTQLWRRYAQDMAGLNSVPMTECTRDGALSVVTYENGAKVYVNYGEDSVQADGVEIPARDYLVRREGAQ